jgi:hypothetical protein
MRTASDYSTAAIIGRLATSDSGDLESQTAKAILQLRFHTSDEARMDALLAKAQAGQLTEADERDLSNYRSVGHIIELLWSRARRALRSAGIEP